MSDVKDWLLRLVSMKPVKQIKDSEGVITNYYRNGTISLSKCKVDKCSSCDCKS
jgi:hypothetical protein